MAVLLCVLAPACLTSNPALGGPEDSEGVTTSAATSGGQTSQPGPSTGPEATGGASGETSPGGSSSTGSAEQGEGCSDVCFPKAPGPAWSGPALLFPQQTDCPSGFSSNDLSLRTDPAIPDPDCTCECGALESGACSHLAAVERTSDAACLLFESQEPVSEACTSLSNPVGLEEGLQATTETAGSCAPSGTTDIQPPVLETALTVCSPDTAAACTDGVCLPELRTARPCVWQPGEHECPARSGYYERTIAYSGFEDQRGCEPCSCGGPSGLCGGAVEFFASANCSGAVVQSVGLESCQASSGSASSARFLPVEAPPGSCSPSPGTPNGSIVWENTTTLCCSP